MQSWLSFEIDGHELRADRASIRQTLADYLDMRASGGGGELTVAGGPDSVPAAVPPNEPWHGGRLVGMLDLNGGSSDRPIFRCVDASILPLVQAADRTFVTPGGLRTAGAAHPVIEAMARHPLLDCDGDGLANILICLLEAAQRGPKLKNDPHALSEQLDVCFGRTTDYPRLRRVAIELLGAGEPAGGVVLAQSSTPAADVSEPVGELDDGSELHFIDDQKRRYYRPTTVVDALKLRRQYPEARWIAGGTDLGESAWRREADWSTLIGLDRIEELQSIYAGDEHTIEIGSAATLSEISEQVGAEFPLIPKMLRRFGSRAIRNRATLGGHLGSASPSGDLWPVLMALGASVRLNSIDSERDVPVASFFEAPGKTTLRDGEMIRSIVVPRATPQALAAAGIRARICDAYKIAQRRQLARAMVGAGFCIDLDGESKVRRAVIAYSGVADRPLRARETESHLVGKPWDERTIIGALQALDGEIEVTADDALASRAYRRQVVITVFQKFFYQYPTPAGRAREFGVIGPMLEAIAAASSVPGDPSPG